MSWVNSILKSLEIAGSAYKMALVKTMLEEFVNKDVLCADCRRKVAAALDKWTERISKKV